LKITLAKEKERRKRKSEEEERRRREKSNGCNPSSYNGYSGDSFWPKKKEKHCMTEEIYLTVTLPKILPDIPKCTVPEF